MTVKVGDIVRYDGKAQRIMLLNNRSHYVTFSSSGTVSFPDLAVLDVVNLEIATPHQFEPGDKCLIQPIPKDEKQHYGVGWAKDMDRYISQIVTIKYTRTSPLFGPVVTTDTGYEFQTYHLEPIHQYDII